MKLSEKAQAALQKVVDQFKSGDLSPIVQVARLDLPPDRPAGKWSLTNRVLAYMQAGSLDCRGYRQWQQAGRWVKRGARAAFIFVPRLVTVSDDETGEQSQKLIGFCTTPVYAYHDTEGDALSDVDHTPRQLPPLTEAAQRLGVKVTWQPLSPDRLGDCTPSGTSINVGTHDPSVFFHELAHAAHAKLNGRLRGGQEAHQETVAEFTAAVLMHLYGLGDRTGNAWRYIQRHNQDPLKAIVQALSTVERVIELLEEG